MIFYGRITADIKLKKNSKGTPMCDFSLAVKNRFGGESSFFDFTAFGNTATFLEKYAKKGGRVIVTKFDITTNLVEKEGRKTKYHNFIASEVQIIDFKDSEEKLELKGEAAENFEVVEDEDFPF